jgi:hypothetical protein
MKINSTTPSYLNLLFYSVFSSFPLDILESNIIIFNNVNPQWDSCECGDIYGCNHGYYVSFFEIKTEYKTHELILEHDCICFDNDGKYASLPIHDTSLFDFIRMCQLCDIELELSEFAISILK